MKIIKYMALIIASISVSLVSAREFQMWRDEVQPILQEAQRIQNSLNSLRSLPSPTEQDLSLIADLEASKRPLRRTFKKINERYDIYSAASLLVSTDRSLYTQVESLLASDQEDGGSSTDSDQEEGAELPLSDEDMEMEDEAGDESGSGYWGLS